MNLQEKHIPGSSIAGANFYENNIDKNSNEGNNHLWVGKMRHDSIVFMMHILDI